MARLPGYDGWSPTTEKVAELTNTGKVVLGCGECRTGCVFNEAKRYMDAVNAGRMNPFHGKEVEIGERPSSCHVTRPRASNAFTVHNCTATVQLTLES